VKNKELPEKVQHWFTHLFKDLQISSTLNNRDSLDYGPWKKDELEQISLKCIKIVNGLSTLPISTFFEFRDDTRTRGPSLKLIKQEALLLQRDRATRLSIEILQLQIILFEKD